MARKPSRYQQLQPDVVLMDLQMPRLDGVEAIVRIRALDPRARIIVLTTYRGDVRAVRALQAGASAYLLKTCCATNWSTPSAWWPVAAMPIPPAVAASIAAHVIEDRLSPRETEVLRYVAGGLSNKRIGERMQISEQTVKAHMKSLMDKLGAGDRTHAVTQCCGAASSAWTTAGTIRGQRGLQPCTRGAGRWPATSTAKSKSGLSWMARRRRTAGTLQVRPCKLGSRIHAADTRTPTPPHF